MGWNWKHQLTVLLYYIKPTVVFLLNELMLVPMR